MADRTVRTAGAKATQRRLIVAVALLCLALPFECPAPLIYTPGKGWAYEQPKTNDWRRLRAVDQLAEATNAWAAGNYSLARKGRTCSTWPYSDYVEEAACLLGRLYATGKGVPFNERKARGWLAVAIANGGTESLEKPTASKPRLTGGSRQASMLLHLLDRNVLNDGASRLSAIRDAAEKKDKPEFQALLGGLYAVGEGTGQDLAEAEKWLRKASEKENADAMYLLGCLYLASKDLPQDQPAAARLIHQAADCGLAPAQFDWAFMNVPPQGNAQEFFPNLFASANQGYAPAQIILAAWYETATTNAEMQTVLFQSSGQPASCWACQVEAHKWASVAESQGVESMREMLVNLAQSMSEEQLEEAKKRAKALLETHTLAPPKTP